MKWAIILLVTAVYFAGCSGKSEKEYYQEADIAFEKGDYEGAIALFEKAIDCAPKSAYAESSQYRIALVYSNDLKDVRKSMDSFRKFRESFPESKEAPTALFLIAYFYNNELHQLDSARMVYEEFLKLYPDDKLAHSAKFELESLGKDPLHVLQSQTPVEEPPPRVAEKKTNKK